MRGVAEDWRVRATLEGTGHVNRLLRALREHEVRDELRETLAGRVAVSGEGDDVFLYADSEAAARAAEDVVHQVAAEHEMRADVQLDRWHESREAWVDAAVPLPATEAERQAEHEQLEQEETDESEDSGVASWEVLIELPSRHEAAKLAQRLRDDGYPTSQRWKYLFVGATNEDEAAALAQRVSADAPAAIVHVEPTDVPAQQSNPFAVLGGLAG
jgi:hypothetical protein